MKGGNWSGTRVSACTRCWQTKHQRFEEISPFHMTPDLCSEISSKSLILLLFMHHNLVKSLLLNSQTVVKIVFTFLLIIGLCPNLSDDQVPCKCVFWVLFCFLLAGVFVWWLFLGLFGSSGFCLFFGFEFF